MADRISKINLEGALLIGNAGDGLSIVGEGFDVSAKELISMGNGGHGVSMRPPSLVEKLGFSNSLPPDVLADVLTHLLAFPAETREQEIVRQGFAEKLGPFLVGASTVTANLLSILADSGVASIIRELWRSAKS